MGNGYHEPSPWEVMMKPVQVSNFFSSSRSTWRFVRAHGEKRHGLIESGWLWIF
jgi:hypothetical protein